MKTFLQTLTDTELSNEDFEAVLRLWGVEGRDAKSFYSLEEILVQRTYEPISARFVWEYLQPDEREVLYAILKNDQGKGIERTSLHLLTSLPEERFNQALAQIIKYALIPEEQKVAVASAPKGGKPERVRLIQTFSGTMDILYSVGKELYEPWADRSTKALEDLLTRYSPSHIYQLKQEYQLSEVFVGKNQMGQVLATAFKKLKDPQEKISGLSAEHKKLYAWLRASGGRVKMAEVRTFMDYSDSALRIALQSLEKYILAFDTLSQGDRILFIPNDVLDLEGEGGQGGKQKEAGTSLVVVDEPELVRMGEMTTLFDIAMLVGMIYQQRIELTQSGTIMKRYLPKLRPLLSGLPRQSMYEDDAYPEMVFRAMSRLQLVKIIGDVDQGIKDHFEPGLQLDLWAKMNPIQQAYNFLHMWSEGYYWIDLVGTYYTLDHYAYPNSAVGRKTLLKHLSSFEKEHWYSVEELLDRIWEQDPSAFYSLPSLSKKERLKHSASYIKWRGRDAELYIGSLGSTLNELGVVSLGYAGTTELKVNQFHNPSHFMLTELGAAALTYQAVSNKKSVAPVEAVRQTLLVQPNFELLQLQPDFPTLYSLYPFSQVNQVGLVSRLTLTQASVLKALENGYTVEQIIETLNGYSQKELPQNVVYSIRDWSKSYREVSISAILLLEVSDEASVKMLCNSSKLKKFGFRALGSTSVVTEGDIDITELRRALEKEGIVVHVKGNIASQKQSATYGRSR